MVILIEPLGLCFMLHYKLFFALNENIFLILLLPFLAFTFQAKMITF